MLPKSIQTMPLHLLPGCCWWAAAASGKPGLPSAAVPPAAAVVVVAAEELQVAVGSFPLAAVPAACALPAFAAACRSHASSSWGRTLPVTVHPRTILLLLLPLVVAAALLLEWSPPARWRWCRYQHPVMWTLLGQCPGRGRSTWLNPARGNKLRMVRAFGAQHCSPGSGVCCVHGPAHTAQLGALYRVQHG